MSHYHTYGLSTSTDSKDCIDALEVKFESKPYQGHCDSKECDETKVVDLDIGPVASYGNGFRGRKTLCVAVHADFFYEEV